MLSVPGGDDKKGAGDCSHGVTHSGDNPPQQQEEKPREQSKFTSLRHSWARQATEGWSAHAVHQPLFSVAGLVRPDDAIKERCRDKSQQREISRWYAAERKMRDHPLDQMETS